MPLRGCFTALGTMPGKAMTETTATYSELEQLDGLIAQLEGLLSESDESPLLIDINDAPKRGSYRVATDRRNAKPHGCDAVYLDDSKLVFRCSRSEVVRLAPLEVTIQAEKSGRGETFATITGKALGTKRVRGGYEIEMEVSETKKTRITPGQRLRDCAARGDAAGWNRWVQEIRDNIELMNVNLRKADLSGFDLCCCDFTGSDLSDANLTGAILAGSDLRECNLERATVSGADFFRVRMTRKQAALLPLSGMPEVESVLFTS